MKIAICDDEDFAIDEIERLILSFDKCDISYDISRFCDGEKLLQSISGKKFFDIIFIDVELNGINGIDIAEKIKIQCSDTIIIFVSNHSSYALDAFRAQALRFLVKPVSKEVFDEVFSKAVKKYLSLTTQIVFKRENERFSTNVNDIIFVEGYHRHIMVHTKDGAFESVGKLGELFERLQPFGFVQIHQGYIVNMNHIKHFGKNDILLDNGATVSISVRKKQEALNAYDYFMRKQCF